jgi:NADPH2:quinone reductase
VVHGSDLIQQVRTLVPGGVDHIVEVAFGANLTADLDLLAIRGSIATYATDVEAPSIPVLAFAVQERSRRLPRQRRFHAGRQRGGRARDQRGALFAGWEGMPIAEQFSLDEIATAHEQLETSQRRGRLVLVL